MVQRTIFKGFKNGKKYEVFGVARHSEDEMRQYIVFREWDKKDTPLFVSLLSDFQKDVETADKPIHQYDPWNENRKPRKYQHFKNKKFYLVYGVAGLHKDTSIEFIVYEGLYRHPKYGDNHLWIRPRAMFEEIIERDGRKMRRFELIEEK